MLFGQNAEIAGNCFGQTVGKLIPGALADMIVVDYDPPTPLTASNIDAHILFGVSGRAVETTIVGGRIAMQDRQFPGIDEEAIMAKARDSAARLWQRF
jgi:cytosine/adenosine deaminase-related metal-dependent hydrolase